MATLGEHLYELYKKGRDVDFSIHHTPKGTKIVHSIVISREDVGICKKDYYYKEINVDCSSDVLDILIHYLYLDSINDDYSLDSYIDALDFVLRRTSDASNIIKLLLNRINVVLDEMQDPGNSNPDGKVRDFIAKHHKDKRIESWIPFLFEFLFSFAVNKIPVYRFKLSVLGADDDVGNRIIRYICTSNNSEMDNLELLKTYQAVDPKLEKLNTGYVADTLSRFPNITTMRFLLAAGVKIPFSTQ